MSTPYYQDDSVTLYHGDCLEITEWLAADVLVTDPPYGIGWKRGTDTNAYSKPHPGIANDHDTSVRDRMLSAWGSRPGVVFGSFYAPFPADIKQVLVWHKPEDSGVVGSTTGHRRDAEPIFLTGSWPQRKVAWSSVMRSSRHSIKSVTVLTGHPHTKPTDLLEVLIERLPMGVVADPFAGSGSTLVAAARLGRKAIGVELEEKYCEIAARRLSQGVLDFGDAS